jgi:dienelactone hydrolase
MRRLLAVSLLVALPALAAQAPQPPAPAPASAPAPVPVPPERLPAPAHPAPRSPLWGTLSPGPHAVGFRTLALRDAARPLPGSKEGRPLQVSLWYPATPAPKAQALRYGDYVGLSGREQRPEGTDAAAEAKALAEYRALLAENGVPKDAVAAWMDAPLVGVRDAPVAPGRFPLVLVAQGNFHSAHHQVVLCELLASQGYLVATLPSPMRLTGPMKSDAEVLPAAQAQAEDLAFALAALRTSAPVDPALGVSLVGHSFGARAAFLLALREGVNPAALVSLDGGIGNASGKDWLKGLRGFKPASVHVPVLHLFQEGDEVVQPDFTLLRSLVGTERTLVRVRGMRHADFSSLGPASALAPALSAGSAGTGAQGYAASALLTLRFLDATLKRSREAPGRLVQDTALLHVQRWPVGSRGEAPDGGMLAP